MSVCKPRRMWSLILNFVHASQCLVFYFKQFWYLELYLSYIYVSVNHKDESSVMHLLARLGNFHTQAQKQTRRTITCTSSLWWWRSLSSSAFPVLQLKNCSLLDLIAVIWDFKKKVFLYSRKCFCVPASLVIDKCISVYTPLKHIQITILKN